MLPLPKTIYEMLRKRYLVRLKNNYVKNRLNARKGKCLACGTCCRQSVPFCPFLTVNNKCRLVIWFNWHPKYCKIFPIDETDQQLLKVQGKCGYYWEPIEYNP